jgi:DNA adenine methylase
MENKTLKELIALCKEKNIRGLSGKKKADLIALLTTTDANPITKPFLKWVGGKTQLLPTIFELFPAEIHDYYEPFLGGGSVLFALLSQIKANKIKLTGTIYASDLNENLINVYKTIQTSPTEFIEEIKKLRDEFYAITGTNVNRKSTRIEEASTSQESYYYWTRSQYNIEKNELTPKTAAMFLFLNKTCFRGLYRVGPNGFNVPFEKQNKNPSIFDEEHIMTTHELIKDVVFSTISFTDILKQPKENDFVYLDPPYAPETATSFTTYTADGFAIDDHTNLFKLCDTLTTNQTKLLLSNSSTQLVRDHFQNPKYTIKIVSARRAINSKNPDATTNEVLITNY